MIVRTSVGGRQVRVRLSNAFSGSAVTIGSAAIARSKSGSAIDSSSTRALTFSGRPSAIIYAGQTVISDSIDLAIAPLTDLAISLYLPGDVESPTNHRFGLRTTYVGAGDLTSAADFATVVTTTESYYWLAGVDVLAPPRTQTIVAFGDSITDGDQSTPGKLASWPTRLAERLQANRATAHIGVVNAGIAGNRILGDNGGGLARFVNDAIAQPGVSWIILLEGINDITAGHAPAERGAAVHRGGLDRGVPPGDRARPSPRHPRRRRHADARLAARARIATPASRFALP